jgi:putative transposase
MEKFKNKFRIPSARWQSWDYANPGMYFLTICTHDRLHFFGEIENGEMYLNGMGQIAYACWEEIPMHFPNMELGAFVVMPNHVHGIVIVNERVVKSGGSGNAVTVETLHATSLRHDERDERDEPKPKNEFMAAISPHAGSVSAAMRSYKSAVSRLIRTQHADFAWQARFHDHVIRNSPEYERIERYILLNPEKWKEDKFFK